MRSPRRSATLVVPSTSRVRVRPTAPPVASFDPDTGKLSWGGKVDPNLASAGSPAPQTLGEESWKWLFLQPLTTSRD